MSLLLYKYGFCNIGSASQYSPRFYIDNTSSIHLVFIGQKYSMLYLGDMQTRSGSTTYSNGSTTSKPYTYQGIHTVVTNFINDLSKLYSEITTSKTKSTQSSFTYISTQLTESNLKFSTKYTILTKSTIDGTKSYTITSYTESTVSKSFIFVRTGVYRHMGGGFRNNGNWSSSQTYDDTTVHIIANFGRSYISSSSSDRIRTTYNINV